MGLLDFLSAPDSGNGIGGLLSYLQSPLYQSPLSSKSQDQSFTDALRNDPYGGSGLAPPQTSIWDQPGITYGGSSGTPPSAFTAGAPAFATGLPQGSPAPQQQNVQQASPPIQQPPQPAQGPTPANAGPVSTMNIGGYQMPQMGSAADYTPTRTTPANAQPAQGQLPQAQQSDGTPAFLQPPSQAGFGGAFRGMAANMQGGPLGMLMGAIGGAAGMGQGNPQDIARQNMRAQYDATRQALIANGVSAAQANSTAMLAVLNPEAAKTVLPELLTNREKYGVISENPVEGKKYGFVNERDQTINGKPLGSEGSGGQATPGMLAPGAASYNPNLSGNEYMAQFSPEVQAAAKAYMNGDVMPTGNPRAQGITTLAKTVAQKVGQDLGTPVNDQTYAAKRQMMTELSKSSPNSAGGILSNGKSAFAHLAEASDRMANLGNYSGPNIPGGAAIASVGNYIGNAALPTPDTAAKITGVRDNLLKYGQEATKFYAGTGGGEAERMNAARTMDPSTSPAKSQAEFLDTEKGLMLDRLRAKENQVREQLGQDYLDKHPVVTDDVKTAVAKIDANIAKLRGDAPTSSNTTKSGVSWSIVK